MAKFTDAKVVTLKSYFETGDQPTEAQFAALIDAIQEGIEEHDHSGTGDGDGVNNLVGPVGIGTAAPAGDGGFTPNLCVANPLDSTEWVAIGYDHAGDYGYVYVVDHAVGWKNLILCPAGGSVVVGATAPVLPAAFEVHENAAGYVAHFFNDGNNNDRQGLNIQCGVDLNPTAKLIVFRDGGGGPIGWIIGDGAAGVTYHSISDERLKNIIGPVDANLAMEALVNVTPIQYVGKGSTERENLGFSAQDVRNYFPEAVSFDEESDRYAISYERLVPVLWAQNKVLLERIEKLEV